MKKSYKTRILVVNYHPFQVSISSEDAYYEFYINTFDMAYYDVNKLYPFYHFGTVSPIPPYEEYITHERLRSAKRRHRFNAEFEQVLHYPENGSGEKNIAVPIIPVSFWFLVDKQATN